MFTFVSSIAAGAARGDDVIPSQLARDAFTNDGAHSFRVEFADDRVVLRRTSYELPAQQGGGAIPAYHGAALRMFDIVPGPRGTKRTAHEHGGWDHQTATYETPKGWRIRVIMSRLTPAILIDSEAKWIAFRTDAPDPGPPDIDADPADALRNAGPFDPDAGVGPQVVSFLNIDGSMVYRKEQLADVGERGFEMTQPWLLAWFGHATPYRNHTDVVDVAAAREAESLPAAIRPIDMPLLFRLEHKPTAIRQDGNGIRFEFADRVGKIALMPAMGAFPVEAELSDVWRRMPHAPLRSNAITWSDALADYPLSVAETFRIDRDDDALSVRQQFTWLHFRDDWRDFDERELVAPLPPMLATAIGSEATITGDAGIFGDNAAADPDANFLTVREGAAGLRLTVHQGDKQLDGLVDGNLMDTPGQARLVRGGDYEYRLHGLSRYLFAKRQPVQPAGQAKPYQQKLEAHVRQMIDAGHLAPLLTIRLGEDGQPHADEIHFANASELATTLQQAMPYLSPELQKRAVEYLRSEWRASPPWRGDLEKEMRRGASRAAYAVPWADIDVAPALARERKQREAERFGDLYGFAAYHALTGELPDAPAVRAEANRMVREMLATQDWALMLPVRPHEQKPGGDAAAPWYERNGQAMANCRLAGAIGLARLARAHGWEEEERLAWYVFGKLAAARIGMARYTAELHRTETVYGREASDWRTLVHIDRRAAILSRGRPAAVALEQQELPPFIGLVPEVGALLDAHARDECRLYLDHLDHALPRWFEYDPHRPMHWRAGNVRAQAWVLGKRGEAFTKYVDDTPYKGDLYYMQNLVAAIETAAEE